MSGFTRDARHYGEQLVYEALLGKWDRYHARCGCGQDWVEAHAVPAGLAVVRRGSGFVALTGPGLTEGVDEDALTTNVLWRAVTGTDGAQDWPEHVRVIERGEASEEERRVANDAIYGPRRERAAAAKTESLTTPQSNYLSSLITKVSRERLDELFAEAVRGTGIALRQPEEKSAAMLDRLTKAAARKLITLLKAG